MSRSTTETVLLWLFVINLGVAFGAGLYEHRVVVSRWISGTRWDAEAARRDDTGRRFWGSVTTLPLTLITLANLVAAWRESGSLHSWWLGAAMVALAERAITFTYFIPTMVRLMRTADSAVSVKAAARWSNLNYLRNAITLIAWLRSLKAFSLLYER